MTTINSHLYASKTILKAFSSKHSNSSWSTFFIKLPNLSIKSGDVENVNTRKNGYSAEAEKVLSRDFESAIAQLNHSISKHARSKTCLKKSEFNVQAIKKFFAYQCIRDESAIRSLQNLNPKELSDMPDALILEEAKTHYLEKTFREHALIVAISPTGSLIGCNFLIPLQKDRKYETLALPISPHALLIMTNDYRQNLLLKYVQFAHKEINPSETNSLNKRIIETGKRKGLGYIFSDVKEKLEMALNTT